jgi:E3 ubiquitin-protein ligase RGLG
MGLWSSKEAKQENEVAKLVHEALGTEKQLPEWAIRNEIFSLKDLTAALKAAGLESSNLLLGIDFTGSNKTQGSSSFGGKCLHALSDREKNPYEYALELIWNSISDFDDNGRIMMYSFGDTATRHHSVKQIGGAPCHGLDQAIAEYRKAAIRLKMSGPTSFAPLIREAIRVVQKSNQFHILLIIGDGEVNHELDCLAESQRALVEASEYPLSIIMVGVGDGPWDQMHELDDGLAQRRFDNFQFVPLAPFQALAATRARAGGSNAARRAMVECAFAVAALQELPAQYGAIRTLGLLNSGDSLAMAGTGAGSKRAAENEEASPVKVQRVDEER